MTITVISDFLKLEEVKIIDDYITANTILGGSSDDSGVYGVLPTLAEVYVDRLNKNWHAPNDARFSIRWNAGISKHRDWNEPNKLHVLLIYLNNAKNGITRFFLENEVVEVIPTIGTAVVFDGYILHEADSAIGRKATLTIDISK